MKIDFDHWQGQMIADEIKNNLAMEYTLMLFNTLKPTFSQDGNQYCYQYGELPNDCVLGFGDTPIAAMQDFIKNFQNQKAIVPPTKTVTNE